MNSNDRPEEDRYVGERERAELATAARRGTDRSSHDRDGDGVDDRRERHHDTGSTVLPVVATKGPERPVTRQREVVQPVPVRPRVGINWGSAFFGWVAAMGLAVILTALVAAVGAAIGVTSGSSVTQATTQISQDPKSVSIVGGVVLAVVIFVAYYCGGYVAARMSRFEGVKQGLGVWVWAIIVAVAVAIAAAVAGAKYDVLSSLNSFPRLPVNQGELTTGGVIALVALLVISLLGALAGGGAGMRYHRKLESHDPVVEDHGRVVEDHERAVEDHERVVER